ncbi:lysylphosphatidylglycerol synthase transmembrane domain-containing protein [Actinoallomurus rhizosphaericola]|uniref:lysylphosphatidylglycerol synthase transmembrane domain-containing protein n=1 Tax=Actinoallomurus rhizosphaericola TaxID=2952536 RepID=UPI0020932CCA|nr:lysylphosphatidylglycerol synthase transmembrane domain-containing protein [Actinoallomurus rhizosphaericola]MCO5998144.1 flippase-like domain-containing protein [Actinoallomurus rhizosphaericola]
MSPRILTRRRVSEPVAERLDGSIAARFPVRTWVAAGLLAAALCGVVAGARLADLGFHDIDVGDWAEDLSARAGRIRWEFVPLIVALASLHYLASGLGVRAAADGVSGRRLRLWEVTASQFAGAAANRLAPSGLGSAAVTCRYLTRRGLPVYEATAAMAAAGVLRGVTKLGLMVLAVGVWNGLDDPSVPAIRLDRAVSRHSGVIVPVLLAVAGAAVLLALIVLCWPGGRARAWTRATVTGVGRSLRHLLHRPRCLLWTLAASTGAHVALALAFAVSLLAVPGAVGGAFVALPAVYLLGATAGAAIPTPAGVGSTEAALITALAAAHVPTGQAAEGVLLFRAMTFWAPVPVGVLSTRLLRRRHGL